MYGNSIKINHKKLKIKHIKFLKSLKYQKKLQINGKKILLAHGAPWKNNFYFYPNIKKNGLIKYQNTSMTLLYWVTLTFQ